MSSFDCDTPTSYVNKSSCGRRISTSPSSKMPFLIGVAGGTASGKTSVCERIMEKVSVGQQDAARQIINLSQDSFYRELTEKESIQASRGLFNFDHPDAFDHDLMMKCLRDIREGRSTKIPVYDFKSNSRINGQFQEIHPSDVVLFDGILVFYYKEFRQMYDLKLFVDTDADTRLSRRVLRDIKERGRSLENILQQYTTHVKPAFEEFCLPTKKFADVIIPRGAENTVAISLVAQHIKDIIWRRHQPSGYDSGSSSSSSGFSGVGAAPITPISSDTESKIGNDCQFLRSRSNSASLTR